MGAFSILPSSKLMHLDLKVTSDLVHMGGHGGNKPKLGGVVAFSVLCAAEETLALSGKLEMEASGGPWAADQPYIIRPQRCNGRLHVEVYLERFTATQRSGAFNRSITQRLFPAQRLLGSNG
jgi:hypothetical protein